MKWILLVYFFVVVPTGGWLEIQRVPYESRFDCQQAEENFNLNPDKPETLMARCKEFSHKGQYMKWALVVYFLVGGIWQSAEDLKYDGWYRMHFETQEICEQYANRFNSTPGEKIKGVCELSFVDELK